MLRTDTQRYAMSSLPAHEDVRGIYFPDSVVQPFMNALPVFAENFIVPFSTSSSPVRFTLQEANALIVEAFTDFHPRLGEHAAALFATAQYNPRPAQDFRRSDYALDIEDGSRWNIHDVPSGTSPRLMRSLPAFSERSEFDPPNPHRHAVIEFDFDGAIDSVIYMAHEAGHAIADDNIVKPEGYRAGDNRDPVHMLETQAYLAQHIVYDYLKCSTDPAIADEARTHYLATMKSNIYLAFEAANAVDAKPGAVRDQVIENLHFRPMALLTADSIFQHVATQSVQMREWASDVVLGRYGPKDIGQVFAAIGIETPQQIAALTAKSFRHAASGMPVAKSEAHNDKSGGPAGQSLTL